MASLITTLGRKSQAELGLILPHEHVFTDLRIPDQTDLGRVEPPGQAQAPQVLLRWALVVAAQVGDGDGAPRARDVSYPEEPGDPTQV